MIKPQMTIEFALPPLQTDIFYTSSTVLMTSASIIPLRAPAPGSRNHVSHHTQMRKAGPSQTG